MLGTLGALESSVQASRFDAFAVIKAQRPSSHDVRLRLRFG